MSDLISRQAAIDTICEEGVRLERNGMVAMCEIKQWCIDLLDRLPSAQQWIPVSERPPKEGVQVLVTDDAGGLATIDVDCGYFDEEYGRFEWFHSQNVTAWMPLPEPWRGEEK